MTAFTVHTLDTAPAASRPVLESTQKAWGFVPNLHATLAESPEALAGLDALWALVAQTTLTAQEQQVAYLSVSVAHGCSYCTMGHTFIARSVNLAEEVTQALRSCRPVDGQPRLQALRVFTETVVRERGHAGDAAVQAFLDAGFTRRNVLEVVLVVATKTISNYTQHLTAMPLEGFMNDPELSWAAPADRQALLTPA